MEPCTKNTNTRKMKYFQLNPNSVFNTWHLDGNNIISHLMLKFHQLAAIPKIARYPSKGSYHFSAKSMKWPLQQSKITHLTLLASAQSKQLSYDNCIMIAVTAFPDSWDSLFKTAMTVDLATWALLIFPHLAKTKTN